MSTIRSVTVSEPSGKLHVVEREAVAPAHGQVRIAVEACGVCHTDSQFVDNHLPRLTFPVTPGHEIAGRIAEVGPGVRRWAVGDRVAVGWFGGHCTYCAPCRRGDFVHCEQAQVPGLAYPGGYAESVTVPANALARVPDELTAVEAAPLACAGVTTFAALRRGQARPGDLVAVLGLGGLGHLGVQFAARMGYDTAVIARGEEKASLARELGARHYIDSTRQDVAGELTALGGASAVLATAANADAMAVAVDGLKANGELLVVGIDAAPMQLSPLQLITNSRTVHGHPSGDAMDVEDTLAFAALHGIRAWVEEAPLEEAAAAYDRMMRNEARFRMVLTTGA
ncbi:alcohol dehydrogenase catalytic domain-containing protein [Streptomyces sp. NPDC048417]|uniref:alcohol dehydrogenase catalytic domain-containing protein n=1 Tax=Streptomyces sp. NPDC048417 TaxID=3155387 RepID=UPI00342DB690